MNYKFFCMILLQSLFFFGSDDYRAQPAQSALGSRSSVNRLRSMVQVNQDEVEISNNQEIVHQENSVDTLAQLVRTLRSKIEELELKEELNTSLYKEKFRQMEREFGKQSRRIAFLEQENNNLYEFIELSMDDAIRQIRLSLKTDLVRIVDGLERQKAFMTLQILRIQEQMGKTSADTSPPSASITVCGRSANIRK